MSFLGSIIQRIKYPHKFSSLRYFYHDPRLIFGIPSRPTKIHISSVIERAMETDIISALHQFLPKWFLDHIDQEGWDTEGYRLMLYLLVRKYKPEIVVETGVAHGVSSAYILCAMRENDKGHLYSIDLPPEQAAVSKSDNGYELADKQVHRHFKVGHFVPECVRDRWTLILGDSRQELPKLLERLKKADIFYHDSLHTYEHMKFEYETVWDYIPKGGLLLSHDTLWNKAFYEMYKKYSKKIIIYKTFGILKKD